MDVIVAEGLNKTYRSGDVEVRALEEVDFNIGGGTLACFMGPSGSGKTTLLNLIGCLDKPTGGRLLVDGVEVATLDRRAAARFRGTHIGFVFQDFNLIPVLTAYENVEYPLVMVQDRPEPERRRMVSELLDAVGMAEHKDQRPDQLSGGQKQRVAVARALVTRPGLVLADEPTANLDHDSANTIIGLMRRMKDELKTTFVFSTHDPRIIGAVDVVHTLEDGALASRSRGVTP